MPFLSCRHSKDSAEPQHRQHKLVACPDLPRRNARERARPATRGAVGSGGSAGLEHLRCPCAEAAGSRTGFDDPGGGTRCDRDHGAQSGVRRHVLAEELSRRRVVGAAEIESYGELVEMRELSARICAFVWPDTVINHDEARPLLRTGPAGVPLRRSCVPRNLDGPGKPRNFTRVRVLPGREPVRIVNLDFGVPGKATAPRVVR